MRITSSGFIALLVLCALPSLAAEIRWVGGVQVDIQPLIDWEAKPKGDRPLKAWKLVQVLEQKGQAAYPVVFCDLEGHRAEILLKNCPEEVLDLLRQRKPLEATVAATRRNVEVASTHLAHARNRREARQAKRQVAAAKEAEQTADRDLANLDRKIRQRQKIYALSTGTMLGDLQVWDTGLRP